MSTEPENDPSKRITRRNFLTFTSAKGLREQGYTFDDPRAPTAEEANDLLGATITTIKDECIDPMRTVLLAIEISVAFWNRPDNPQSGDLLIFANWDKGVMSHQILIATVTSSPHDPAPAETPLKPTYWITQRSAGELTGWYGLEEIDPSVATDPKSRGIVPRTWDHMACIAMLNCDYPVTQIPAPQVGDIVWVWAWDLPSSYHIVTKTPFDPSIAMGVASSGR